MLLQTVNNKTNNTMLEMLSVRYCHFIEHVMENIRGIVRSGDEVILKTETNKISHTRATKSYVRTQESSKRRVMFSKIQGEISINFDQK